MGSNIDNHKMASGSSPSSAPITMDNDWEYRHGRIDPGIEESMDLVDSIPVEALKEEDLQSKNNLPPANEGASSSQIFTSDLYPSRPMKNNVLLTALPSELIDHILSFLGPIDVASASGTCHLLSQHANSDIIWQRHVQENVPGVEVTSPAPCKTFRELYIAHDPHWFLPKYKIFFCDYFLTGKFIVIRYDPRRGCIEGYRLVAERPPPSFEHWEYDDEVLIHSFEPQVSLHMDQPVVQLEALSLESLIKSSGVTAAHRFKAETPMQIAQNPSRGVFSNFLLARPVEAHPSMQVWPPMIIPARHRVRNASIEAFAGPGHKPQTRSEASDQAFRIRRWIEMSASPTAPSVHLGEEVYTYSTLDPKLYTPTKEKPYRGIWVGDYSGHGCEFLLLHQPDDETPFDESLVIQGEDETIEEWEARKKDERINRGSLEAIKLTGDPNVPRGEYTFIADDISKNSFVRTATEERFKGARIVKSRGHIAARMFRNDKYIESQLIMISHDRLAQYWLGFGHISFYQRVDIDNFLSPYTTRPFNTVS